MQSQSTASEYEGLMDWNPFLNQSHAQNATHSEPLRTPWPIPDEETMAHRKAYRDAILRETLDQRRIHPHGGMGETGRNILSVLYDRERKSTTGVTQRHVQRVHCNNSFKEGRPRSWSPSTVTTESEPTAITDTVMEIPMATTTATNTNINNDNKYNKKSNNNNGPHRVSYPMRILQEVRMFGEYASATKYHSAFLNHLGGDDELDEAGNRPASSRAVSTISVAFSPDSQTMASTHGDHTVKISCCTTGRLLQSLEGHPRTPWTVKYHPTDPNIVASGCLGHQVRVWNWVDRALLQMVRLEFAIISLSFHPSGHLLAVANGTRLHFWGVDGSTNSGGGNSSTGTPDTSKTTTNSSRSQINRASCLTELDQRHMLRCVHFPPDGNSIIIGGVNPMTEDPRRRSRGIGVGGMSFYLRLWDFDLETALQSAMPSLGSGISVPQRPISNARIIVPRALLYNDGGFDVSPDGKSLCACAEYWLPAGVDNAMELLHSEELAHQSELNEKEESLLLQTSENDPALPVTETQSAVSAALNKLKGISKESKTTATGRSPTFRDSTIEGILPHTPTLPATPLARSSANLPSLDFIPQTPPNARPQSFGLSPPSPPGRRFAGGLRPSKSCSREVVSTQGSESVPNAESSETRGLSTPPPPPPPPPPPAPGGKHSRPPHPLSVLSDLPALQDGLHQKGRYVPHVITVSLDTSPIPEELDLRLPRGRPYGAVAKGYRPRLGQLLEACPLDGSKASAVTCVKFSPSTDFCLIGYGVREPVVEGGGQFHPVTALYRIRGGITHVSTMLSGEDDVNIARFHPDSGHGFVYGTKQGRVRVLSPQPWNFYNC